jgi:hypothetical protein
MSQIQLKKLQKKIHRSEFYEPDKKCSGYIFITSSLFIYQLSAKKWNIIVSSAFIEKICAHENILVFKYITF